MPATKPRIESLKISISAAAKAPSPASSVIGDLLMSTETEMIIMIIQRMP